MADTPSSAIDFTSRDYASLRQTMIDGIPARMPEWTSRSPQDPGIVLIELFATMGDILSYYADRVASEAFLPTATQRSSILKLAALLNYRPRGTTAARVTLQFTMSPDTTFTVPAGTEVRTITADGNTAPVLFTTDADLINIGTTDGSPAQGLVMATQGRVVLAEQIGVAAGGQDESFVLLQTPVVDSSVSVQVRESPDDPAFTWTFVTDLIDARPADNVYTTSVDENGALTVLFGDGLNGRVPPRSSVITASYRVGGGAIGDVNENTIREMVSPIVGVLAVTNPAAASGGADAESIASIRANAPRALQALGRAITLDDFAALAQTQPQVAKARAEAVVYSNVTVYIAPFGGGQPSPRLLSDVVAYLSDRTMVGVDVVAASPVYVLIDINATINIAATITRSQAINRAKAVLTEALGFDNVNFGDRITISGVYSLLSTVVGVEYSSVTQLVRRGNSGVADVALAANEIAIAGDINITAAGGIVAGDVSTVGLSGSVSDFPTLPGAPTVLLMRCDTTTVHLDLQWAAATQVTYYYVEVNYLDTSAQSLGIMLVGPAYNPDLFGIDVPNNDLAAAFAIRVQAFNSVGPTDVGPASGPVTVAPNICATP